MLYPKKFTAAEVRRIKEIFDKAWPAVREYGEIMSEMTSKPTVECPDCGDVLRIGVGNAESTLANHRGKKACQAQTAARAARAEGLMPVFDVTGALEEEIMAPIRTHAALIEMRPTGYYSGDPRRATYPFSSEMASAYGVRLPTRGGAEVVAMPWVPIWAVDCVRQALDAGDDPEVALLIYWNTIRDLPDFANSMLADARILDKE
jgi:hypothetical protein